MLWIYWIVVFSVITGSFLETGRTWSYFTVAHFVRNVLWNSSTALSFVGLFGSKLVALWGLWFWSKGSPDHLPPPQQCGTSHPWCFSKCILIDTCIRLESFDWYQNARSSDHPYRFVFEDGPMVQSLWRIRMAPSQRCMGMWACDRSCGNHPPRCSTAPSY